MKKKINIILITVFVLINVKAEDISLLMVPDDPDAVKIGLDISSHKPSLILIKYKLGAQNTARLFGWKGTEWIGISNPNYYSGKFFKIAPNKTIVVESEIGFPDELLPNIEWCSNVYKISTLNISSLINLLGTNLDFKYADWISFSNIYNLSMSEINPNDYNIRWYHRRLPDAINASKKSYSNRDLKYWSVVREELSESSTLVDALSITKDDENLIEVDNLVIEEDIKSVINPLTEEPPEAVINN